eukprot:5115762-Prorocentrum_lima.AAC.1
MPPSMATGSVTLSGTNRMWPTQDEFWKEAGSGDWVLTPLGSLPCRPQAWKWMPGRACGEPPT